jgi:hypothetical protein
MPDRLAEQIRAAGEVTPDVAATDRARGRVIAATSARRASALSRLLGSRRGRSGTFALAALLVGGGATATVSVLRDDTGGGFPYRPAPQNCFALSGYQLNPLRLTDDVHLDDAGQATAVWVSGQGIVTTATRSSSGEWGSSRALSELGEFSPTVAGLAGNARGDVAVAWVRNDQMEVAVRRVGEDWEEVTSISRPGQKVFPGRDAPTITVGPSGEVVVVWGSIGAQNFDRRPNGSIAMGGSGTIEVATNRPESGWDTTRRLEIDGDPFGLPPDVEIDQRGVPIISYFGRGPEVIEIDPATGQPRRATRYRPRFAAPRRVIGGGTSYSGPSLAAGPRGEVVVSWSMNGIVVASVRRNGVWERPQRVSRLGAEADGARVSVGGDGRITAVWVAVAKAPRPGRPGYRSRTVWASIRSLDGRWAEPSRLSKDGQVVSSASVGSDGLGRATAIWALGANSTSGRGSTVQAATAATNSSAWATPITVSEPGLGSLFPVIAANAQGDAVTVWSRCDGNKTSTVEASTRSATDDQWSAPAQVFSP